MKLFKGRQPQGPPSGMDPFDLDRPLLQFSESDEDWWTTRDFVEHSLVLGKPGCGKTSGSIGSLAAAALSSGYGLMILAAKQDEVDLWLRRIRRAGRLEQTLVFNAESGHSFNPVAYEYARPGKGAGHAHNIVALIMDMVEVAEKAQNQGGGEDGGYWQRSMAQLLTHVITLVGLSTGQVQMQDVYDVATSLPQDLESTQSEGWIRNSACSRHLVQANQREMSDTQAQDFSLTAQYFLEVIPTISPRTRGIIVQMTTSVIEKTFLQGLMRRCFSSERSTLLPELMFEGGICILDWNLKEWGDLGLLAQSMYAWSFMDALERRDVNRYPRPVGIFVDEAPFFVNRKFTEFIRSARSAKAGMVLAGQSLNSFYAEGMSKESVSDLVGDVGTLFFHLSGDPVTCRWMSDSIGQGVVARPNWNVSSRNEPFDSSGANSSVGGSEQQDYDVRPQFFTQMAKPGRDRMVPAICFEPGRRWHANGGKPWLPVMFSQEPQN